MADMQDYMWSVAVRWDLHVYVRVHASRRQAWVATSTVRTNFNPTRFSSEPWRNELGEY